jgi:hypothetical protein
MRYGTVGNRLARAKIENLRNHKLFSKSKFPYISYIFTGKLDLADVHLPNVYLKVFART